MTISLYSLFWILIPLLVQLFCDYANSIILYLLRIVSKPVVWVLGINGVTVNGITVNIYTSISRHLTYPFTPWNENLALFDTLIITKRCNQLISTCPFNFYWVLTTCYVLLQVYGRQSSTLGDVDWVHWGVLVVDKYEEVSLWSRGLARVNNASGLDNTFPLYSDILWFIWH